MDAPNPLADLVEISTQVDAAVVLGDDGSVTASTFPDEARAEPLARAAGALLAAADELSGGRRLVRLEASLRDGSVFVLREPGACIAATTTPAPTSVLVFHDLKTCLSALAEAAEKPKPTPRRRATKAPADA